MLKMYVFSIFFSILPRYGCGKLILFHQEFTFDPLTVSADRHSLTSPLQRYSC